MNKPEQDARFAELFESYRQPIFGYLYRLLGDTQHAEEVVQDVFVKAYRALPGLRRESNDRAWLYRIATNAANDALRRQKRHRWLALREEDDPAEPEEEAGWPAPQPEQGDERLAVHLALQQLPALYRVPLILYSVQGLSTGEIAVILGIGQSAVKMRLTRARDLFQKAYEA